MKNVMMLSLPLLFLARLSAQEALNNETILKLVQAGINDELILNMIEQKPGNYALAPDDVAALKRAGISEKVIATMIVRNGSTPMRSLANGGEPLTNGATIPAAVTPQIPLILHDATPIRLRLNRNLTSADAKAGDNVDFEVLEDVKVDDVLLVARGGIAIATITEAEHKKRMARGGKLNVNIDYVRLVNGEKVALRAVKETKGGGHTGVMTGGMVATAIVFFPAAPFFLFMHGKDVTIPTGTEITAYVNGEIKLDRSRLTGGAPPQALPPNSPAPQSSSQPTNVASSAVARSTPTDGLFDVTFVSTPANAMVSIGEMAIGRTPFTTKLSPGTYKVKFLIAGHQEFIEQVIVGIGYPSTVTAQLNRSDN